MNHVFRVVWNDALQAWQAVSETGGAAHKKSKCQKQRRSLRAAMLALTVGLAGTAWAQLPTAGNITAGSGAIAVNGNTMTVKQTTARMVTDWQSFSIGAGKTVEFVQPASTAMALNRVRGSDVSTIQGAIRANGQVLLLNPNGVLFTPTAQVNVGGLVASTLNMGNEDFMAGRLQLSGNSTASVINQGRIQAAEGGAVALVAARIVNGGAGQITADKGQVLMGAGSDVTLDLGGPVKVRVNQGALNALITQGAAVQADGGLVYLTAKAAGDLAATVINHSGTTRARTLTTGENGSIYLMGGMARDRIRVGGTLDASAPQGGTGGFVETSAANVQVADGLRVDTRSAGGAGGTWLIDPNDYTVKASGGDITGAALGAQLDTTSVTIATATQGTTGGNGDILIQDPIAKSAGSNSNTTLTLLAERNIAISQSISGAADSPLNLVLSARASGGATGSVEIVGGLPAGVTASSASQPYSTLIRTYGGNVTIGGGDATASDYAIRSTGQGGVRIYNGAAIDTSSDGGATQSIYTSPEKWLYINSTWVRGKEYLHYLSAGSSSEAGGDVVIRGKGSATFSTYNWGVQIQNGSIATAGAGKIDIVGEGGNGGSAATSGNSNSWNVGSVGVLLERSANLLTTDGDVSVTGRAGTGYDRYGIASTESDKQIKTNGYLKIDGDSLLIRDGTLTLSVGRDSDIKAPIVGCTIADVGCGSYSLAKSGVGILNLWGNAEAWNAARPANTRATATNGTFTDDANKVNLIEPGSTASPATVGAQKLYAFVIPPALDLALLSASSATPLTIYYVRAVPGSSIYGDTPVYSLAIYDDQNTGSAVTLTTTGSAVWSGATSTSNVGTHAVTYAGGIRSAAAGIALMPGAAADWQITPRPVVLQGESTTVEWQRPLHAIRVSDPASHTVNNDRLNYPGGVNRGETTWMWVKNYEIANGAPGTSYTFTPVFPSGLQSINDLNPNYIFSYPSNLVATVVPRQAVLPSVYTKKWRNPDPVVNSMTVYDLSFMPLINSSGLQLIREPGERAGRYRIDTAGMTNALKVMNGNIEYIRFTGESYLQIEPGKDIFTNLISKVFPLNLPKSPPQLPDLKALGQQISVAVTGIKISVPKISLPKIKLFRF